MKRVFTISSCLALTTGLALSASSVSAQDLPADQSCPAYYMPIDRINDHAAGTILTTTGAVAVN